MKKRGFAGRLSGWLFGLFWFFACSSAAVHASPQLGYNFDVLSFDCSAHPSYACDTDPSGWRSSLEAMSLALSSDAQTLGSASLTVSDGGFGSPALVTANSGFVEFDGSRWGGPIDFGLGSCVSCFMVDATLGVSSLLSGQIYLNNRFDEVYMTASTSGLWSGFIRSDELGLSAWTLGFTGNWTRQQSVPEPATGWLLVLGALCLPLVRRRWQASHCGRGA